MGYVDKSDMSISLYKVNRKSKKWWHRIMWHFLDLTITNAFIVLQECAGGKTISLKQFRLAVASGLIGANTEFSNIGRTSTPTHPNHYKVEVPLEKSLDKCAHLPVHGTKVHCAHCSTRANPHRSRWHCQTGNVGWSVLNRKVQLLSTVSQ